VCVVMPMCLYVCVSVRLRVCTSKDIRSGEFNSISIFNLISLISSAQVCVCVSLCLCVLMSVCLCD